jgi:nucleotide-binding universal stress UspA family protein
MYKQILVPLDGSELSAGVLPYVDFLAARLQLPVTLLHVNNPEAIASPVYAKEGTAYLKQVAARFPGSVVVDCALENGKTAEAIVDRAAKDCGTLIAMATHGRSGAQRWLLGSITQKVLQASINPLLLIRPKQGSRQSDEVRLRTIVLPLDGSHLAERIFPECRLRMLDRWKQRSKEK